MNIIRILKKEEKDYMVGKIIKKRMNKIVPILMEHMNVNFQKHVPRG
jgi:hypothetical protein